MELGENLAESRMDTYHKKKCLCRCLQFLWNWVLPLKFKFIWYLQISLGKGKIHKGNRPFLLYFLCNINNLNWIFNNYYAVWYPLFEKKWLFQKNNWVNTPKAVYLFLCNMLLNVVGKKPNEYPFWYHVLHDIYI